MTEIWKWIGSNVAELIATCALLFTAYQAYLSRKHNRISVTPRIASFGIRNSEKGIGRLQIKLSNRGLGPAVFEDYQIELDNIPQEFKNSKEALSFIENMVGIINIKSTVISLLPGHILGIGESISIMDIHFVDEEGEGWDHIENLIDRLSLRVRYCSLYADKYEYHSNETHR